MNFDTILTVLQALGPLWVLLAVWGLRRWGKRLPPASLPMIALVLGGLSKALFGLELPLIEGQFGQWIEGGLVGVVAVGVWASLPKGWRNRLKAAEHQDE